MAKIIFLFLLLQTLFFRAMSQECEYGKEIDLKLAEKRKTYKHITKRIKNDTLISFFYSKKTKEVSGIILNIKRWVKYGFINDTMVVISPVGQQPYYFKDNTLVCIDERKHTDKEIEYLKEIGYLYLKKTYSRIKDKGKK